MEINYIDILKNTIYEEEINSEEYLEILAKLDKVYNQIRDKLPYELDNLIKEYEDLLNSKRILEDEFIFKKGIKLGANFILDIKKD